MGRERTGGQKSATANGAVTVSGLVSGVELQRSGVKRTWGRTGGARLLSRDAGRPHIGTVLGQNRHNDLSARLPLSSDSVTATLGKKLVLGAREEREAGL